MTTLALSGATGIADRGWRMHLGALAAAWAAILILAARDVGDIVGLWWHDATFGHCLFVPPVLGWLVWIRRRELAALTPRTWLPGLGWVALGALGWLLGQAAGAAVVRQLALLMMLQGCVGALLGPGPVRGLVFPLFWSLFLVPWGAGLVPPLQTLTAAMAAGLLRLSGVPTLLDGVFITTPAGWFQVAEACSGNRFLIAMLAYGTLVAQLGFRSWRRRAAFLAAAAVVPILANAVRAWGTIVYAEWRGLAGAGSFDHIVYGWIFFALVVGALLAGAWRHFDRPATARAFDPALLDEHRAPEPAGSAWIMAAAAVLLAAMPIAWSHAMASLPEPVLRPAVLPAVPGWRQEGITRAPDWYPAYDRADLRLAARYRDARGRAVDVFLVALARQGDGRELVGFGRGVIAAGGPWDWAADEAPARAGGAEGRVVRITRQGKLVRHVASFYRVGGIVTGNDYRVKVTTLQRRLTGGPQTAAALFLSAGGSDARGAIDAFLNDLGPVDQAIDRATGVR